MSKNINEQNEMNEEIKTYDDIDIGKVASSLMSQFDEEITKISQDKV